MYQTLYFNKLKMVKEKLEKRWPSSTWKKFRNTILATALWATLIGWASACDSGKWKERDKEPDKKEAVMNTQTQAQTNMATFPEWQTSWSSIKPDLDSQGRKIVSTEEYDEDGQHITKEIYEDGSWSESSIMSGYGFYNEYYPNSNNIKFEYSWDEGISFSYTIYDEKGKILYGEEGDTTCDNSEDEYDKYDEKGRLIEAWCCKYIYNDGKNTKTRIMKPIADHNKCKIITEYAIADDGKEIIISNTFVWETWIKIDLINWWIDKLIKDRWLEDIPYIDDYQGMRWE